MRARGEAAMLLPRSAERPARSLAPASRCWDYSGAAKFALFAGFYILGTAPPVRISGTNMSNEHSLSLPELNDRIAVIQNNIRQLVEQAAASSGAQDEERTSGRIAQQQEELDRLVKARDALLKK
jgi:uncharacterized small protein (DUF1192 family)